MTKKEEPLSRQNLHSMPWEKSIQGLSDSAQTWCSKHLNDVKFTHYPYFSSYSVLLKQLFY